MNEHKTFTRLGFSIFTFSLELIFEEQDNVRCVPCHLPYVQNLHICIFYYQINLIKRVKLIKTIVFLNQNNLLVGY